MYGEKVYGEKVYGEGGVAPVVATSDGDGTTRIPAERKRRRPTRSGAVLSAESIVEKALALVEEHGAEALTMRRLGRALGADPSAVYRYFRSMEDLHLALGDRLIGETMSGLSTDPDPANWRASLREFGIRAYHSAQRHPRAALLSGFRVTRLPNEQRAIDTGVGLLLAAGFDEERAVRYYHAFVDTVLGHAALDAASQGLRPEQQEADAGAWKSAYAEVSREEYPHLHAVREYLPVMAGSAFEGALDLMLAAIESAAGER
ncbi:TetR/AcrR family transcriptional regulator [Streptomyces sp. NBC_00237]|uniref:TetR/AcrR family transcriptional regulator n=1 Tax=Streptomyces sp. NBC_00237 TaxID=2975687 RepID=UPI0022564C53|nr:TetR/AcrR family transcriptional regulator [Streptomyces sp. NBC_00237]MCX5200481.1 TetR/AcrR family transcriptional regulator [Streptomyces sp. NBC_00237]